MPTYPQILAGQRLTAGLLTSMLPLEAVKASDEIRTSTTTVVDDTELAFQLAASATYRMDGWIKYSAATAGDLVVDWTIPPGCLGEWVGFGIGVTPISADGSPGALSADTQQTRGYMIRAETNDIDQFRTFGGLGSGVALGVLLSGTVRTGASGGTYALSWAQGTASATPTTIYADSRITLRRTA